jgi:hypothetical protein
MFLLLKKFLSHPEKKYDNHLLLRHHLKQFHHHLHLLLLNNLLQMEHLVSTALLFYNCIVHLMTRLLVQIEMLEMLDIVLQQRFLVLQYPH